MRARGLKPEKFDRMREVVKVAPHAGAWIETGHPGVPATLATVAPHAGAWIETCSSRSSG